MFKLPAAKKRIFRLLLEAHKTTQFQPGEGMMSTGGTSSEQDLQREIEQLRQQLQQAQKMASLGELVSTTTHEFNNILMTIINYAKLGIRHKDEATRDKSLDKIFTAANRAAKITNSVLGMARNRSGDFEPTDISVLIEDTLVLLERELSKYRVSLDKQFAAVPPAQACGNQIQQVLLNLLTNARQAMPNGGTLILRLQHDAAEDTVDLVVRDTGCGIPPDKLPKIFDPYFTTKSGPDASGKGGTGLGLSTCKDIIEAHHGRIRVDSSVGKGTAFTIKLPVAHPAAIVITPTPALGIPVTPPVTM